MSAHHSKSKITILALSIFLSFSFINKANAKDLSNRLGVGYANQMNMDLPSLVANYYPSADLGLSAALGLHTGNNTSKFGLLAKVKRIIFPEDNMNFYMGAGAGLLSSKMSDGNTSESGFELMGFAGGEFFLTGLESLGFSFEAGVGIVSVASGVTFRTIGDSPLKAGIVFYF